ncbi:MAG: DEAD/DEAH box helicase, partial [Vicinamibacterales bacterium]
EQLQGAPLPASLLETEILPARLDPYDPGDLDAVLAAGEVVWVGVEPLGDRDGRLAFYLTDHLGQLLPPRSPAATPVAEGGDGGRESAIVEWLQAHGASFFGALHEGTGGGYPADTVTAIWNLVWQGIVTNDALHALRAVTRVRPGRRRAARTETTSFRSRRLALPGTEGRWSLVPAARPAPQGTGRRRRDPAADTRWLAAVAQQLLARHGVVTREALNAEAVPGGFGAIYPVLKALEEHGRIRRGYFVAGLGATQFALPGALDLLRSVRDAEGEPEVAVLSALDPANPYGATLRWPPAPAMDAGRGPTRSVGATVILVNGALAAFLARGDRLLLTWLPDAEPDRSHVGRAVARVLIDRARRPRAGEEAPRGMLIEEVDGRPPADHPLAPFLIAAGFLGGALGFQATYPRRAPAATSAE